MSSLLAKKKKSLESKTRVNIINTPFLVIVESPSKCAKIEKFLGFEYKCIASKGHIRELVKVGTAKENYNPTYDIIASKSSHVSFMKNIISQFAPENIFIGTDDDREGEGIAWHICEVCSLDPYTTKRILFNEITKSAIIKAVENPTLLRMNIVHAQQARQVLDRMIGFKISPLLTKLLARDNGKFLSAGRCQTPTLKLIYDKFEESKEKEKTAKYKIRGTFFQEPSSIIGTLGKHFSEESEVVEFLKLSESFSHIFYLGESKEKRSSPPKPFNTSNLLQYASSQLHISPKRIMECCQNLYQDGHITYMRTDSRQYAKEFLNQMKTFLLSHYSESYLGDFSQVSHKTDLNPHEAIRVTHLDTFHVDYKDKKTMDVYNIIWKRTVESCMSDYEFKEYQTKVSAPQKTHYSGTVEDPTFLGWKRVSISTESQQSTQMEINRKIQYWKSFHEQTIIFRKLESTLQVTNHESHYQESSLIQALEKLGIGRPSTYSMLVETIQERKYALKEDIEGVPYDFHEHTVEYPNQWVSKKVTKYFGAAKNQLCIQNLGIQSINVLYEHFPTLFDYDYTREMEAQLDKLVQDESIPWYSICEKCEKTIQTCLTPLQAKMKKSYSIDDTHELIFGKTGAVIRVKNTKEYKSVQKQYRVNFEQLINGLVRLEDILEVPEDCLGIYENEQMFIKKGPYGAYVEWGSHKENIDKLVRSSKLPLSSITIEMVENYLAKNALAQNPSILRILDKNSSVRKGKNRAGNYIFYKNDTMKKPAFIPIRKCPHDVLKDDIESIRTWVYEQLEG